MFNNLGHLYPGKASAIQEVKEFRELVEKLDNTGYQKYFEKMPDPVKAEDQPDVELTDTIDDCQKRDLSRRYSLAFLGQYHFGVYYAYLKLKELEIMNLVQLAEIHSIDAFPK